MDDPIQLFPELREWNNGKGIGVDGWMSCYANAKHAVGYLWTFWPEFIEHDGCVFFKNRFSSENFGDFMKATNNRRTVEDVMNHYHVADFFMNQHPAPSMAEQDWIAEALREMWSVKLAHDFPSRKFVVEVRHDHPGTTHDLVITFRQMENS